jgi:hypothetical protein
LRCFELWRELNLSTEGNQPIPHELADRAISWSRSQEPVFFVLFRFSIDWLQIGWWPLRGISPTALWACSPSFVAVGEDLATNRKIEVRGDFSGLLEHDSRTVRSPFPDCPVVGVEHRGVSTLLTVHSRTVRQQLADSPPFAVWPV